MILVPNKDNTHHAQLNGLWFILRVNKETSNFEIDYLDGKNGFENVEDCFDAFNEMERLENYDYTVIFNVAL